MMRDWRPARRAAPDPHRRASSVPRRRPQGRQDRLRRHRQRPSGKVASAVYHDSKLRRTSCLPASWRGASLDRESLRELLPPGFRPDGFGKNNKGFRLQMISASSALFRPTLKKEPRPWYWLAKSLEAAVLFLASTSTIKRSQRRPPWPKTTPWLPKSCGSPPEAGG